MSPRCVVCDTPSGAPIYHDRGSVAVTSTSRTLAAETIVYACPACAHVQTEPLADIAAYYDSAYNVHLESEAADDLYETRAGVAVYRAQHQAAVALEKLALRPGAAVLDYGCGKAMTLREMLAVRSDLDGAVFDMSDNYRDVWSQFVPPQNQASYETPGGWDGRFDVVLAFFALEHVAEPRTFLASIRRLLARGGTAHVTVPNVRRNNGDLIVVDHVNHFMPTSLRYAFEAAGFVDVRIDEDAHTAAYVVDARRSEQPATPALAVGVAGYLEEIRAIANFWSGADDAVRAFERRAEDRCSAIYGGGFYGVFIGSRLTDVSRIACYLDQNPFVQLRRPFGRPVVAPEACPAEVDAIYVGLNPARAGALAAEIPVLQRPERAYFYLALPQHREAERSASTA